MKCRFVRAAEFREIFQKLSEVNIVSVEDLLVDELSPEEKVSCSFNHAQAACPVPFPLMALIMAAAAGAP